jgi:hypothetical protein
MNAASKLVENAISSVSPAYVHYDKVVKPGENLELSNTTLKWYNLAPPGEPVPIEIYDLARAFLKNTEMEELGDLGFVILHRCGRDFYFLLVSSWRNENELWETVYAKNAEDADFSFFPFPGEHRGTFCVWEFAAVWHEQQAWRRFLMSARDQEARRNYLSDTYRGPA